MAKTGAERERDRKTKKRKEGLFPYEIWVKPEWRQKIKDYIDKLRKGNAE